MRVCSASESFLLNRLGVHNFLELLRRTCTFACRLIEVRSERTDCFEQLLWKLLEQVQLQEVCRPARPPPGQTNSKINRSQASYMARHCSLWFMNSLRRWFTPSELGVFRSLSVSISSQRSVLTRSRGSTQDPHSAPIIHRTDASNRGTLYLNEQHEFHWVKFILKLASELSACSVSITCYKRVTSTNEAVWALVINWPLSEVPATRLLSGAIADSLSATILYTQWLYEPSPVSVDYPSNITNCHRMVGHSNARSIARDLWSFDALNVSLRTVIQLFDLLPPVPFSGAFRAPLRSASALSALIGCL